jgi:iron-sulfur cluster repair protein YtfE (RIC family)
MDPLLRSDGITADDTLNKIVARYPDALPVLQRLGLDTCCGGALPLRTAAQHHDLDLHTVLAALRAAVDKEAA